MMIRVPSQISVYQPGYGGSLSGLGQDEGTVDTPTIDTTFSPVDISTYDPTPDYLPGGGAITPTVSAPTSGGGGLTAAQITSIAAAAGQAAINIAKATSTPGLIPGTNLVYNPATNQFLPASGAGTTLPGTQVSLTPTGLSASLTSGTALAIAGVIGAIALIFAMKR